MHSTTMGFRPQRYGEKDTDFFNHIKHMFTIHPGFSHDAALPFDDFHKNPYRHSTIHSGFGADFNCRYSPISMSPKPHPIRQRLPYY